MVKVSRQKFNSIPLLPTAITNANPGGISIKITNNIHQLANNDVIYISGIELKSIGDLDITVPDRFIELGTL